MFPIGLVLVILLRYFLLLLSSLDRCHQVVTKIPADLGILDSRGLCYHVITFKDLFPLMGTCLLCGFVHHVSTCADRSQRLRIL